MGERERCGSEYRNNGALMSMYERTGNDVKLHRDVYHLGLLVDLLEIRSWGARAIEVCYQALVPCSHSFRGLAPGKGGVDCSA